MPPPQALMGLSGRHRSSTPMAKVLSPKKLSDYHLTSAYSARRDKRLQHDPKPSRPASTNKTRRNSSYIPGESLREEPVELPRLFIRGTGGSIKMDLGGVGIELPPESFAFTMPDESLGGLHIHAGDIAIIQPLGSKLCEDSLLMVQDGLQQTIRHLVKRGKLWFLETGDGKNTQTWPLLDQSIEGVVLGFVRLFKTIKPVSYRKPDSFYDVPRERNFRTESSSDRRHKSERGLSRAKPGYRTGKKSPVLLAAEGKRKARTHEAA